MTTLDAPLYAELSSDLAELAERAMMVGHQTLADELMHESANCARIALELKNTGVGSSLIH